MPEIGEVARLVKRLNVHLVGKTIASISADDDSLLFKDTTASAFKAKLQGCTVKAAKQWGKYFWLVMDKPPHPLMHLGMTGWIHFKNDPMSHYRAAKKPTEEQWPPRFHKFVFKLKDSDNELAFVDARRLARVRLIDHDGEDLRSVSPLKENGPDPVIDPPTLEWLQARLKARKVPIKAWLLDQSAIAGVGNWVADEILFQSRIHPECYTHNLEQIHVEDIHKALLEVTKIAVDTDADSSKFPKNWLMIHRWGKGKKSNDNKLPSGEQIEYLTVGGRTSAYVRNLQRKVGPVSVGGNTKSSGKRKKATKKEDKTEDEDELSSDSEAPKKKAVLQPRKICKSGLADSGDG